MKIRLADFVIDFFINKNIKTVFLLSGGGMMHLLDAVNNNPEMSYICNHHEQASGFAAEGYARASETSGLCFATSGPGATNLITSITSCWQDSVPVFFITGQAKLSQTIRNFELKKLRQFGTFEVDIISIVDSITKYSIFLNDPQRIKYHLEKAYELMLSGRPGPVLIDIPVDLQGTFIETDELISFKGESEVLDFQTEELIKIQMLLEKIKIAKKPVILAGHGIRVSKTIDLFLKFARDLNIPIVTTQLGKDVISYNDELFVGHVGLKGDRAGNFAIQSADLILNLGCSLHVFTTGYQLEQFASNAYKVQVDIDENILRRQNVGVDLQINMDLKTFFQCFGKLKLNVIITTSFEDWRSKCLGWKYSFSVYNEPHQVEKNRINYYKFLEKLNFKTKGNEIIVTDAGSAFYVVGQAWQVVKNQRVIISGALGAMGYALPAASGASVAAPNKMVICVTGDGSLQTNIHELATIAFNKLNIKIFVMNNNGYISIKNTQKNFFDGNEIGVNQESGVFFPDLELISKAYGLTYVKIQNYADIEPVLSMILEYDGPVFCEVLAQEKQEIIPSVNSKKLPTGQLVSQTLDNMSPDLIVIQ